MTTAHSTDDLQVELVDAAGRAVGAAGKLAAHQPPGQRHRAFSVLLLDRHGRLLVQQRAAVKHHWALCWSNTCCSHPAPGQAAHEAASERVAAELGIAAPDLTDAGVVTYHLTDPVSGLVEWEYNHLFVGWTHATPAPDPTEVAGVDWIPLDATPSWMATVEATAWFPLVLRGAWSALQAATPR